MTVGRYFPVIDLSGLRVVKRKKHSEYISSSKFFQTLFEIQNLAIFIAVVLI